MIDGLPIVREAFPRTVRLVSNANLREGVLKSLVDEADLEALYEIEGATSTRLLAQDRGLDCVSANEFVFGVPHAKFVNAAFAYSKQRELSRFNGPGRGAWYAALDVDTCIAEIAHHMTSFLSNAGIYDAVVDYVEVHASLAGEYLDLRNVSDLSCLDPEPTVAYPAGNALADAARARGLNGVIYPSVRHNGGTCIVALWPQAVQSPAQGAIHRLVWNGKRDPIVEKSVTSAWKKA